MNEVGMFSKGDLLQSFSSVDEFAGCYFFQHKLPKVVYEYCLKSSDEKDLLVISEGLSDRAFRWKFLSKRLALWIRAKLLSSIFRKINMGLLMRW